jgi:uncharacterized protein (TIGR02145 family)
MILTGCWKEPDINYETGTFTDSRDNHVYKLAKIGQQTWMDENLAWLPSVNSKTTFSKTEPLYYVYGYDAGGNVNTAKKQKNYAVYGVLYNWPAALTACPSGWHLPSDEEWKVLENYLGMSHSATDKTDRRDEGRVGYKMKSTSGWSLGANGDNSSGFNAFPGGYYFGFYADDPFSGIGEQTRFWSSTQYNNEVWFRFLCAEVRPLAPFSDKRTRFDGTGRFMAEHSEAESVRCLKD